MFVLAEAEIWGKVSGFGVAGGDEYFCQHNDVTKPILHLKLPRCMAMFIIITI